MNIEEKIIKLISEHLNEKDVTAESKFINDLQADSMDMVEIILIMEKEFNFLIRDYELKEITNKNACVGDLINLIQKINTESSLNYNIQK